MIVRELQEDDLVEGSGFFETLANLSETPILTKTRAKEVFLKLREQGSRVFVAVKEKIVGSATIMIEQKFSHNGACCGHIEDVVTRKGYERQGIGSAVVKAAMQYAKKQGCYKIILDCSDENVPFYEKAGFSKSGNCMRYPAKNN